MKITLMDGAIKTFTTPQTILQISESIAISLKKSTIAAKVDGYYVPVDYVVTGDCTLELITTKHADYELVINHSAAFLTAVAVQQLYPNVQLAEFMYKADELEFGMTFMSDPRIGADALPSIQKHVDKLIKNAVITTEMIAWSKAKTLFSNNPYQLNIAKNMQTHQNSIFTYQCDDIVLVSFIPIVINTHTVKAIAIEQLSGVYWKNNAKNIMLQKIHGIAAESPTKLVNKQTLLQERRGQDHRLINNSLKVFGIDPLIGAGLPLWLPNGAIIKEQIKNYLKQKEWEYDYIQVTTPVIGTINLYKQSGHWDHYGEDMFQPFRGGVSGGEQFILRPMNCPHHVAVYKQEQRSYRDLPLRLAEHALQHRYESSGSLTGLERVRAMELTDSHVFVRADQVEAEFKAIYQLITEVLQTFHIEIDYLSLSLRDPADKVKYYQDDQMWDAAEASLEKVLIDLGLKYKKCLGEAAFYGPKLDIQIKTAQNHEITVSTIQLDFLLPKKFDISYIDHDQSLKTPIMIHRGLIGTYERFIAILLEQTKGVLPLWLAPTQVTLIPIGDKQNLTYAQAIKELLKKHYIRTHIDTRDERLNYKIRDAQINKIPFQLVLGDVERTNNTITYRQYGTDVQKSIDKHEFVRMLNDLIKQKK